MPAGLLAGVIAVVVTVAIERWGGRIGGVLGTMPTTIVPAALGIAAQASTDEAFARAINMAPAGMFINALFLYLWRLIPPALPRRWSLRARLSAMTATSLLAWVIAAAGVFFGVRALARAGMSLPLFGALTTAGLAALGLAATLRPLPAPRGRNRVGAVTLIARGALAAASVGFAVWLASAGLGLLSGVASVFPAIFLTTMFSLWLSQGEAVPAGAVGPMMLGSTSVAAFCAVATWTFPLLGPGLGAAVAWVAAVAAVTLPAALWLGRRREPREEA